MEMAGEQRIAAPRQRVWEALNDPAVLQACIPGCQALEKDGEDRFTAVAEVKIGPIGARFKGAVALSELDPPNGYTITGQGNGGIAGSAKGKARVRLAEDAGGGTLLSYVVEAEVGGRMAQLGGPIIDATAKQLATKFFSRFDEVVAGRAVAAAPAPAAPVAEAVSAPAPLAAPAPVPAGGFPWALIVAVGLAILAGFLLGRSAMADWWVVAVALLALVTAGAGYEAGRRSGRRA